MATLSVKRLVEEQSLLLFKIGGDSKNFDILEYVANHKNATVSKIMEHLERQNDKTSIMPANRRVNQLASVGLVERKKGKVEIKATKLGLDFIEFVKVFREKLIKQIRQ